MTTGKGINNKISTFKEAYPASLVDRNLESVLSNGVTIYGKDPLPLANLMIEYQDVFRDVGTVVSISEEE